ncbi:putative membrane protein [Paenibacillus castaneae]|nr:DUF1648 domain-containing protein [Paenibacillus castaneae]NIK77857.1 putative membrane protein [Paenibacillus castaneae]
METRPVLVIPKSSTEKWLDYLSLVILLYSIIYLILKWSNLPQTIPIHFNVSGEADGWGSKTTLIILPLFTLATYTGLNLLRKIKPDNFNYPVTITKQNAPFIYKTTFIMLSWVKLELVAMLGYVHWSFIQNAAGLSSGLGIWLLPVTLIIFFSTIVHFILKIKKYARSV